MLPKPKRLNSADFIKLNTRNVFRGFFVDIALSNSHNKNTKFACVISKKKIKKSVDRNRVKRRIYSIIEKINLNGNYDIIIYPKFTVLSGKFESIKSEIEEVFGKL